MGADVNHRQMLDFIKENTCCSKGCGGCSDSDSDPEISCQKNKVQESTVFANDTALTVLLKAHNQEMAIYLLKNCDLHFFKSDIVCDLKNTNDNDFNDDDNNNDGDDNDGKAENEVEEEEKEPEEEKDEKNCLNVDATQKWSEMNDIYSKIYYLAKKSFTERALTLQTTMKSLLVERGIIKIVFEDYLDWDFIVELKK